MQNNTRHGHNGSQEKSSANSLHPYMGCRIRSSFLLVHHLPTRCCSKDRLHIFAPRHYIEDRFFPKSFLPIQSNKVILSLIDWFISYSKHSISIHTYLAECYMKKHRYSQSTYGRILFRFSFWEENISSKLNV